jgi:transcriptional regulator with PAS, ATPase and Fis domain
MEITFAKIKNVNDVNYFYLMVDNINEKIKKDLLFNKLLKTLISESSPIVVCDFTKEIVFVNQKFLDVTKFQEEHVLNKPLDIIYSSDKQSLKIPDLSLLSQNKDFLNNEITLEDIFLKTNSFEVLKAKLGILTLKNCELESTFLLIKIYL